MFKAHYTRAHSNYFCTQNRFNEVSNVKWITSSVVKSWKRTSFSMYTKSTHSKKIAEKNIFMNVRVTKSYSINRVVRVHDRCRSPSFKITVIKIMSPARPLPMLFDFFGSHQWYNWFHKLNNVLSWWRKCFIWPINSLNRGT